MWGENQRVDESEMVINSIQVYLQGQHQAEDSRSFVLIAVIPACENQYVSSRQCFEPYALPEVLGHLWPFVNDHLLFGAHCYYCSNYNNASEGQFPKSM